MNSASGGDIIFHFKGNDTDLKKTTGSIQGMTKSLLVATGITKAVSAGFNLITSSMDSAIDRYDTLNNFPKVMQNFGVSNDEAAKSVQRVADSILDLPTSLDQAVAGVQALFMVTKDLPKAEKMFQAINDSAMVFANGSTEAVDRFIYAYKQSMAMGKVHAQEFNQMNEAIPGVMDKVAEAMGVNFAELKEGLSEGDISIEQFNDTLMKLDTEGVGSMKALRDSAFEATGGISTAITNMHSRVAAGLKSMLEAVDEGLKANGLGGIAQVFSNLGTSIKNTLISLAPAITKTITLLVNFGNWVNKNKAILGAILIPIGAFITILNVWQNTVALVKAAQIALNSVMAINPFVLIIAAIVALVAMFAYLWNTCEGFRNFWIGLWEGIKAVFQAVIDGIVSIFTGIVDFFANNWTTLLLFLVNPFVGAFKLLYDKCEGFRNFVNGFVQAVIGFFQRLPGNIKQIATTIVNTIKSIPGKVVSIGLDIVKGIGRGITSGVSWIKSRIKEFVGNVTSFIKKVFKIGSPSKLMSDQVGQWIPKGIAVGIDANTDSVYDSMKEMQDSISGNFGLSPQLANSLHYSPSVNVVNNVDVSTDPLGQTVNKIKTFSGGAKNDYNYGMGV